MKLHVINDVPEDENLVSGFADPEDMLTDEQMNPKPTIMDSFQKIVDSNNDFNKILTIGIFIGSIGMLLILLIFGVIWVHWCKKPLNNNKSLISNHEDRFQSIRYVSASQNDGPHQTSYNHPALQHQISMNSYNYGNPQYSPNDNYNNFQPTISQNHVMSANGMMPVQQTLTRHFPLDMNVNMNNNMFYHHQNPQHPQHPQQFMQKQEFQAIPQNFTPNIQNPQQFSLPLQNQQPIQQDGSNNAFMKNSGGGSNGKTTESSHLSSDYASENIVPEKVSCPSTSSSSSGVQAQIQVQKNNNEIDQVVEI